MNDPDRIVTGAEWMHRPTWHGSYSDYVSHMRGIQSYLEQVKEDRLADKIAAKLAAKLRRKVSVSSQDGGAAT